MTGRAVLITDSDIPGSSAQEALSKSGFRVFMPDDTFPSGLTEAAEDAEALVVQWASITGEVMDRFPRLRFISRLGIGYDMIDVEAATARGIAVANTPSYCIEEVATHSLAMILSLARGLPDYDRSLRAGVWKPVAAKPLAVRPSTTTVAVVGFGRIGSKVAGGLRGMGFRVLVTDPFAPEQRIRDMGCEPVELSHALAQADIVSLHVPLDAKTRHMLRRETMASMKQGAIVVNTCRGGLINESDLIEALKNGQVGAAGLDVYESEPLAANSPLLELDNVLLSPHAAWYSEESLKDLPVHAAQNVIDFFTLGASTVPIVNPEYANKADRITASD